MKNLNTVGAIVIAFPILFVSCENETPESPDYASQYVGNFTFESSSYGIDPDGSSTHTQRSFESEILIKEKNRNNSGNNPFNIK